MRVSMFALASAVAVFSAVPILAQNPPAPPPPPSRPSIILVAPIEGQPVTARDWQIPAPLGFMCSQTADKKAAYIAKLEGDKTRNMLTLTRASGTKAKPDIRRSYFYGMTTEAPASSYDSLVTVLKFTGAGGDIEDKSAPPDAETVSFELSIYNGMIGLMSGPDPKVPGSHMKIDYKSPSRSMQLSCTMIEFGAPPGGDAR